ncbi:hypothetical protein, partial [Vibrio mediterranei]
MTVKRLQRVWGFATIAPLIIRSAYEKLGIRLMHSGAYMSSRKQLANAIRALSMDGVQQANSGHPGAPM